MKKDMKNVKHAVSFLLVWFCGGVAMHAFQMGNEFMGVGFAFLSFLHWMTL